MRKAIIFLLASMLLVLAGCASSQNKVNESENQQLPIITKTGTYVMECKKGEMEAFSPRLKLNIDDSFIFMYDVASSNLYDGYYQIEDNVISARSGKNIYLFTQIDEMTLSFKAEGSSDVSLIDERLGIPIEDGAIFKLDEDK